MRTYPFRFVPPHSSFTYLIINVHLLSFLFLALLHNFSYFCYSFFLPSFYLTRFVTSLFFILSWFLCLPFLFSYLFILYWFSWQLSQVLYFIIIKFFFENYYLTILSLQVKEQGAYSMKCPGYKCGEILDAEWAPVLLKPELVIMLKDQRLRHVSFTGAECLNNP